MLAILTPFEGKGWALARWLTALKGASLPDSVLLWLCNAADRPFYNVLEDAAAAMPQSVILWRDTERMTGPTPEHTKDATVARLWRELRKRIPEQCEAVLTLEDDVLLSPGTVLALLALAAEHGRSATVAVAPVPNRGGGQPDGAWVFGEGGIFHAERQGTHGRCDCAAFGCTLYPRALFDQLPLTPGGIDRDPLYGYDNEAGRAVYRLGGRMIAAWNLQVEHMEHPPLEPEAAGDYGGKGLNNSRNAEWYRQHPEFQGRKQRRGG